jgi:hypothetical protein
MILKRYLGDAVFCTLAFPNLFSGRRMDSVVALLQRENLNRYTPHRNPDERRNSPASKAPEEAAVCRYLLAGRWQVGCRQRAAERSRAIRRPHLTYPRSHLEVRTLFRKKRTALSELEYQQPPQGRVVCNTKTQRFIVLADRCILTDRKNPYANHVENEAAGKHRKRYGQPLSVLPSLGA